MKDTRIDLVKVLEQRNKDGIYDKIIKEAKAGEFHCYKNNKYPTPKFALLSVLKPFPELKDIREEVKEGIYDEKADEEDLKELRKFLPRQAWKEFGL